jgi:hypothetical protein
MIIIDITKLLKRKVSRFCGKWVAVANAEKWNISWGMMGYTPVTV